MAACTVAFVSRWTTEYAQQDAQIEKKKRDLGLFDSMCVDSQTLQQSLTTNHTYQSVKRTSVTCQPQFNTWWCYCSIMTLTSFTHQEDTLYWHTLSWAQNTHCCRKWPTTFAQGCNVIVITSAQSVITHTKGFSPQCAVSDNNTQSDRRDICEFA